MSKINKIRIINLNYNNNLSRVDDETFEFEGESTLISLRNGGGKSVLIQMIMSLFVHGSYRNIGARKFKDYFTLPSPTIVMVEWLLDSGNGFVLTGMLVRKRPDNTDDLATLELFDFIGEYTDKGCPYHIDNIGFVEHIDGVKHLKSFGECKKLMEQYKKDSFGAFLYYDMNQNSKGYFTRLLEFGINYKEWETIIHKINEEESGLSDLFKNVKDESGLIEKWFLKAIEDKLNEDSNLIGNYVDMVQKYIKQYRVNQAKIEKREHITLFHEKAKDIQEKIIFYQSEFQKQNEYENKIYSLIEKFQQLEAEYRKRKEELEAKIQLILQEISRKEHEKISCELYELKDHFEETSTNLKNLQKVILSDEKEAEKVERNLQILECARLYDSYRNIKKQVVKHQEQLAHSRKKEEEKLPEINRLGNQIYSFYNLKNLGDIKKTKELTLEEMNNQTTSNGLCLAQQDLNKKIGNYQIEKGSYIEKIKSYDRFESEFNSDFDENMMRTMTGYYEEGFLEKRADEYRREEEKLQEQYDETDHKIILLREQITAKEKAYADCEKQNVLLTYEKNQEQDRLDYMEQLISRRKTLIKYVEISPEFLFDTTTIIEEYEKEIKKLEAIISELTKKAEKIKEEFVKLSEGKMLELPKEISDKLEEIGISATYGMEWLKKNSYSIEKNEKIVENNPFIPYSILLSNAQIKKLEQADFDLYTSFPIPIVEKEKLETFQNSTKLFQFDCVKFYVWFNKNLLDEEKLEQMKQELGVKIKELEQKIEEKKEALRTYINNRNEIEYQKLSSKEYFDKKEKIEELSRQIESLEETKSTILNSKARKKNEEEELTKNNQQLKKQKELQFKKRDCFAKLALEYETYVDNKEKLDEIQRGLRNAQKEYEKAEKLLDTLSRERERIKENLLYLDLEKKKNLQQLSKFERYAMGQTEVERESMTKDISLLEARYDALVSDITGEIKWLEEALNEYSLKEKEEKDYLDSYAEVRKIEESEYKSVKYSKINEKNEKEKLDFLQHSIQIKMGKEKEIEKQAISLKNQYQLKWEEMNKFYHFDDILPKSEIAKENFDKLISEAKIKLQQVKEQVEAIHVKYQNIVANLTALAEYQDFAEREAVELEGDFRTMKPEEIDKFRGILIRDYRLSGECVSKARERLKEEIDTIKTMSVFSDDYFQIPLANLLNLVYSEQPESILEQFGRVLEASKNTMEKLNADLELFEREEENILSSIMEYIKAVYDNLGSIDKNSSIVIRKRPIKMLKINLLEWNEAMIKVKLSEFLNRIKEGAMTLYDRNENTDEYISKYITTTRLYDTAVGIHNAEINLYKIEEGRETKITWKEGMKNSGGEGFLSAFVVLSSLMCYMRHGRNDLFYEKNEGKVLIMDNPFAQTTSAHLLKPLMEMAKRTNTQLICLSGIGGEAIYSRFDNIYVLNLIPSGMKKGLCILKGEQKKRDEVVETRIQVEAEE